MTTRATPAAMMGRCTAACGHGAHRARESRTAWRPGPPRRPRRGPPPRRAAHPAGRSHPRSRSRRRPLSLGSGSLGDHDSAHPGVGGGAVRTVAASAIARRMCSTSTMGHILVQGGFPPCVRNYRTRFIFCREGLVRPGASRCGRQRAARRPVEHRISSVTSAMIAVCGRRAERRLVVGSAQDAHHRPCVSPRSGLEVARRVAYDHDRGRVGHAQPRHGPENQVGRRAAPPDVGRGQGQIDFVLPAQGVEQGLPRRWCKARREADGNTAPTQRPQDVERAGDLAARRPLRPGPRRPVRTLPWPWRLRRARATWRTRRPSTNPWSRAPRPGPWRD